MGRVVMYPLYMSVSYNLDDNPRALDAVFFFGVNATDEVGDSAASIIGLFFGGKKTV